MGHRYIHTAPAKPALVLPEVVQGEFSILDSLIDDYMQHEAEYRPRLDAPRVACGTSNAGSGFRQWHSEYEAVGELLERHEMRIVGECWDRLGALHNQALRLDYMNRRAQVEVWRNPRTAGMTVERLREITAEAKRALKTDLRSQGVKVDAEKREA